MRYVVDETMNDKAVKACVAMGCLTALEAVALIKNVDGALFAVIIAAIAGIGGFTIGRKER